MQKIFEDDFFISQSCDFLEKNVLFPRKIIYSFQGFR